MSNWSDWIEHDGTGCPCFGKVVNVVGDWGSDRMGKASYSPCWLWYEGKNWPLCFNSGYEPIIRYRVLEDEAIDKLLAILDELPDVKWQRIPA